jgi:hypothetical protein
MTTKILSPQTIKEKSKFGIYEARRNMISIFMEVVPAIVSEEERGSGEVDVEIPVFAKMVYQSEDVGERGSIGNCESSVGGEGEGESRAGDWILGS